MKSRPFLVARDPALRGRFMAWSSPWSQNGASEGGTARLLFPLGRHAIYQALKIFGIGPGHEVLVPAYICDAAVQAVRASGAVPVFYRVGADCSINLSDIASRISPRSRAVLVVHYFGFLQEMTAFCEFAQQHRLALIEDSAHVLPRNTAAPLPGFSGHAVVYSWRKFLPSEYGAELVLMDGCTIKNGLHLRRPSLTFEARVLKCLFDSWCSSHPAPRSMLGWPSGIVRWVRSHMPGEKTQVRGKTEDANSSGFDPAMAQTSSPKVSRYVLRHSEIGEIVVRRKRNYRELAQRLQRIPGVELLFPNLPDSVCPLLLPLFLRHLRNAHLQLRETGIPATAWDGVRPSGVTDEDFPEATFLYNHLIFLPVHQDLRDRDLDLIALAIKNAGQRPVAATAQQDSSDRAGEGVLAASVSDSGSNGLDRRRI